MTGRRRVLGALAAGGLAALAGCSGGGGRSVETTRTTASTTRTTTDAPTSAEATTDAETTAEEAERTAVEFVTRLANGDAEAAMDLLAERARSGISAAELTDAWNRGTGDRGQFVAVTDTEYGESNGYHVVVVTAEYTGGRVRTQVVLGEGGVLQFQFPSTTTESYQPPEYADPSSFTETDATVGPDCSLPATLTVPNGDGPFPAVVLVHGSGPQDRDSTVGPNKPFKDLAWGLATNGVAVLRYRKRTAADCAVETPTADSVVVEDAVSALETVRDAEAVAADRTVVVGHSLGGMLAPKIARRDGEVAGVGTLAAPARPLSELIVMQVRDRVERDGTISAAERERLDAVRAAAQRLRTGEYAADETILGLPGTFWRSIEDYDQVAVAADLDVPLLVAQGGRDVQVSVEEDFERWKSGLPTDRAAFHLYPELNHLFVSGEGPPSVAEYYETRGNVAERVILDAASWLGGIDA